MYASQQQRTMVMRLLWTATLLGAMLAAVSGYELDLVDFWAKRGTMKAMESCLTKEATQEWVEGVQKALAACEGDLIHYESEKHNHFATLDWYKIMGAYAPTYDFRQKRSASSLDDRIEKMKLKFDFHIKRFRCIMQKLGVTDRNNHLTTEGAIEYYRNIKGLNPTLIADLEQGVLQCAKMAKCAPVTKSLNLPVPADLLQAKNYLECESYLRYWSCLKDDVRADVAAGKFDLSGVDGTLDFLPNDEARAATILMAEEIQGGDDFNLYE